MYGWNIFSAWTNHMQTWTHKTDHGLDLKEATIFPIIIFSMFGRGANTRMSFRFMTWDSQVGRES
jgi:hypothetical protein